MALLVEKLIGHTRSISRWGYHLGPQATYERLAGGFEFMLNQLKRSIGPSLSLSETAQPLE